MSNGNGNGHIRVPVEVLDAQFQPVAELPPAAPRRRPLWPALVLFFVTLISTLAAGSLFAMAYAHNTVPDWGDENPLTMLLPPIEHPHLLLLGVPFSFTLLGFLMAHEMGHFFACKYYGIDVSYPYFIPSPLLFGTFGAVLRIRSPIRTRRALFDVGIAGPVAGFIVAVPLMAYAVATSKIVPGAQENAGIIFGNPPLMRFFIELFHPGADPASLLLSPVGRAAWFGLIATVLNLLPVWQLDGGHIVFSLTGKLHQRISLGTSLALIVMGIYLWPGWAFWGIVLLVLSLRFRHPPLLDRWEPLDQSRRAWAVVALVILILCFTPWPATSP